VKRKQYREEKIIAILKEHEAGTSVPDLARRHGVAENTIYRWKAKFGGMEVSDAKKLRALEQENQKLKRFGVPRIHWRPPVRLRRLLDSNAAGLTPPRWL
jgi:putative transposase